MYQSITDAHEKIMVSFACMWMRSRGWFFDFDARERCWDIETPNGWKVARNGTELCSIIQPYIGGK